jgi:hypothetical protein
LLTPLKRFFRLLHLERRDINYIYLYASFAGAINLTLPLGIQAILNFLQAGAASSSWWLLIAAVTAGTLLAGALIIMQMSVSETLQRRLFARISFDFAARLPALQTEADLLRLYRLRIRGTEVHSIHTEVEGTAHLELFRKQLDGWKADGVTFVTLEQIAREVLLDRNIVPVRSMSRITIPNRGGFVSSGYAETGSLR